MALRISDLKLRPDHSREMLEQAILKTLRISESGLSYEIMRRSIDARKKNDIYYVYTIDVTVKHAKDILKKCKNKKVSLIEKKEYRFPAASGQFEEMNIPNRPVIVGSGPAGLFCALMLARAGLRPVILERGESVENRIRTVHQFWEGGPLNPQSNVQFGEGGAGTFSDGKLNTLIKDPSGRIRFVLKEFVKAGASEEILYHHKPHIGTDVLVQVVRSIREEILSLGGEIRYNSCLTGISPDPEQTEQSKGRNRVYHLEINGEKSSLSVSCLILAIGHSARDTFQMLDRMGLQMEAKAFAVGFRLEHPQQLINDAMYGENCPYELGAAPYKVTHKCTNGRGVYSFCMCPGGYVVNASSEPEHTAVNGMSYSDRGSSNANSAIVVTVSPEDYQGTHPLAGIAFQREIEKRAWEQGHGKVPVQRFEDFCENRSTEQPGEFSPQIKGQFQFTNLRGILPEEINCSLEEGIHAFGQMIKGFDSPDALLSGVESRTSSPVRIVRDESLQSSYPGIYPCGEGAGYAGGITSAAVDGIRVAEAVIKNLIY